MARPHGTKYIKTPERTWELPLKKTEDGNYIVIPRAKGYSAINKVNANKIKKGYVYFIRCANTQFYKIGVSINPYNRIQSIDSNCPHHIEILSLHYLNNPYKIEEILGKEYKKYNQKKEWYIFNIDIAKNIMIYLHNTNVMQDNGQE